MEKLNVSELPTVKHEVTLFVSAKKPDWSNDQYSVDISSFNMSTGFSSEDYIHICELTATIEIPDIKGIDFTSLRVDKLEQLKTKVRAECQVKLDSIDCEIQSLLAIESK